MAKSVLGDITRRGEKEVQDKDKEALLITAPRLGADGLEGQARCLSKFFTLSGKYIGSERTIRWLSAYFFFGV